MNLARIRGSSEGGKFSSAVKTQTILTFKLLLETSATGVAQLRQLEKTLGSLVGYHVRNNARETSRIRDKQTDFVIFTLSLVFEDVWVGKLASKVDPGC